MHKFSTTSSHISSDMREEEGKRIEQKKAVTKSPFIVIASNFDIISDHIIIIIIVLIVARYRDCAGNKVEENSSVFSLIRMR